MKKKKILIVDDSPSLRQVIRHHLSVIPHAEIFEAGDGEEAEALIQEHAVLDDPIHLIMLDWMMPKVTGLQFLERIRSVEAFAKLPLVVMLTAETYPEQVTACLKYSISAYLTKPFTQENIVNAVTEALKAGAGG